MKTIHSNSNGQLACKWLGEKSGQPSPPAFVVPLSDDEWDAKIKAAPDGKAGQEFLRGWATNDFQSRHQGAAAHFEQEVKHSSDILADINRRVEHCRQERDKTPETIITVTKTIRFPDGFLRGWLIFVICIIAFVTCLEWFNAAHLAAQSELQSIVAGLAFTLSLALVPVALKLFSVEPMAWKRVAFMTLLCVSLFCFVHVFTDSFLTGDQNASTEQLVDGLGSGSQRFPAFWRDPLNPHWRFLWQMIAFTLVGFSFSNYIGNQLTVVTSMKEQANAVYQRIERKIGDMIKEREILGRRFAEADGNRREWNASLERHISDCVNRLQKEERRRHAVKALQNFLEQEARGDGPATSLSNGKPIQQRRTRYEN